MSALQLWLQNHNRKLTQDAIDEALMEYISLVESQRDALKQQRDELVSSAELLIKAMTGTQAETDFAFPMIMLEDAIASVKEKQNAAD